MSFLHPEFPQGGGWFDRSGLGSLCWFRGIFERFPDTAAARVPLLRAGNDRFRRGADDGERIVFHVVQGQHRLDHRGALLRAAAQLGGQHFPVFQAGVAALADAAELGLQPVRGPLRRRQILPARLAAAGDDGLVPAG